MGAVGGGCCRRGNRGTLFGSVQYFFWIKGFPARKLKGNKERGGGEERQKEKEKKTRAYLPPPLCWIFPPGNRAPRRSNSSSAPHSGGAGVRGDLWGCVQPCGGVLASLGRAQCGVLSLEPSLGTSLPMSRSPRVTSASCSISPSPGVAAWIRSAQISCPCSVFRSLSPFKAPRLANDRVSWRAQGTYRFPGSAMPTRQRLWRGHPGVWVSCPWWH